MPLDINHPRFLFLIVLILSLSLFLSFPDVAAKKNGKKNGNARYLQTFFPSFRSLITQVAEYIYIDTSIPRLVPLIRWKKEGK